MNNIEILENCWLMKTNHVLDEENKKVQQAIENLIQEYKELKEETTENQDYIKDLQKKLTNAIEIKYIHQDYIPKSKVKEKIDKIQELQINYVDGITFDHIILELEELLEEGE